MFKIPFVHMETLREVICLRILNKKVCHRQIKEFENDRGKNK